MPAKVLVTREIPEAGLRTLREAGFDVTVLSEAPPAREELLEAAEGAEGVLSTVTETIDGEFMEAAGDGLKVVANMAVGYDNVDLGAAGRGASSSPTPRRPRRDHGRRRVHAPARRGAAPRGGRAGPARGPVGVVGPEALHGPGRVGKRLGVVGLGRIGKAVARRARGFGMEVVYYNRSRKPEAERELGARRMELGELLETSDFVSVHTPLTEEAHHLIGAEELGRMKPRAVLVNTSRGPVVDEAALADALEAGNIFAAGLDVYEEEPKVHPKLLERENVVLAPHIGSGSIETRDKMAVLAAENIRAVLMGEPPKSPVEE
ncbi:2-hydroxyacid dehydrogenase [Rubrobacter marinus]|uniref:2-hydroxyacid dehydrogenase n=1 Tax=Rubrobacter marinus TaxID=2653852 RepID=UPI001A9F7E55|nr:D-glycerate dehydrogenase [Rubrobacter marinus]